MRYKTEKNSSSIHRYQKVSMLKKFFLKSKSIHFLIICIKHLF